VSYLFDILTARICTVWVIYKFKKKMAVLFSLCHSVSAYYLCLTALLEILSMYKA